MPENKEKVEKKVESTLENEKVTNAPETEAPKRKRGRPRKNANADNTSAESKAATAVQDSKEESKDEEKKPAKRTRSRKKAPVDEYGPERVLLRGAKQTKKILTSMIERMEQNENIKDVGAAITVIVQYEGFRILIPASEMGLEVDENLSYKEKEVLYKKYITPMLGSVIDFVIMKVDDKTNLAIGSRKIAMAIKKKQIYQNRNRSGGKTQAEWAMETKVPIPARVVSVAGTVVKLEVYGVECKVLARDADWIYTADLSTLFSPGDDVKCIIKEIEVNPEDKNDIKIIASIREAYPNRQIKNSETFKEGSMCVGVVTGVGSKGVYVLLGDRKSGITGFCNIVHGSEYPHVNDKVVCKVLGINTEEGYAHVKITRFIQKKSQSFSF